MIGPLLDRGSDLVLSEERLTLPPRPAVSVADTAAAIHPSIHPPTPGSPCKPGGASGQLTLCRSICCACCRQADGSWPSVQKEMLDSFVVDLSTEPAVAVETNQTPSLMMG